MGQVFLEVVLPVALVAILGGMVGHWRKVQAEPLSVLMFYLFAPALVFHSIVTSTISADESIRITIVTLAVYLGTLVAATLWSTMVKHDPSWRAAFALALSTPNTGNMGLPLALLAFGKAGFDVAVVNFVAGAMITTWGGISVASLASGSRTAALLAPLRFPMLYAALAGVAVNAIGLTLPVAIEAPITSLAGAAIPGMLVILGLQMHTAVGGGHLVDTAAVTIGRLLISPVIGWFTATALGITGVERATLTVLAAMPTAVIVILIASQFRTQPAFVTRAIVTTTIASMLTLTVLIALVR